MYGWRPYGFRVLLRSRPPALAGRSLELAGRDLSELLPVLDQVRPGGVRALELNAQQPWPDGLWAHQALHGLDELTLGECTHSSAIASCPTGLQSLALEGEDQYWPEQLLTASAATLASLHLDATDGQRLEPLAAAAPALTRLSSLSLDCWSFGEAKDADVDMAKRTAPLISRLPALRHLTLRPCAPTTLVRLLARVRPPASLAALHTHVFPPCANDALATVSRGHYDRATRAWLEGVRASAAVGWVGQLERWRFEVGAGGRARRAAGERLEAWLAAGRGDGLDRQWERIQWRAKRRVGGFEVVDEAVAAGGRG